MTPEHRCVHGAGPRSGQRVVPDQRSCRLGKPLGTFLCDGINRDGDEQLEEPVGLCDPFEDEASVVD